MSREECVQFLLESKTSFNDPFFSDRFLRHFIYFSRENDARYDSFDSPSPWSYSWKDFSLSSCFHFLPARRLFLTNFPPRVRSIKQWFEILFFPFRSPLDSKERIEIKYFIFFLFSFFFLRLTLFFYFYSFDFSDSFFENPREISLNLKWSEIEYGFRRDALISRSKNLPFSS